MKEKTFFINGMLKETDHGIVVYANRCVKCGATYFPAEHACRECMSEEMEEFELDTQGILYTYTVMYRPTSLYPAPHAIGIVNLPKDRIRVYAPLVIEDAANMVKGDEFQIGSKLEMIIDKMWEDDDKEYIGFKFRVLKEGGEN